MPQDLGLSLGLRIFTETCSNKWRLDHNIDISVLTTHTLFDKTDMATKQQRYVCYVLHMLHASAYMQLHM